MSDGRVSSIHASSNRVRTCLGCGNRSVVAHGGGYKCRDCGREEPDAIPNRVAECHWPGCGADSDKLCDDCPLHATRNRVPRGAEAFGIIREAIKASKNAARRRGADVTYYEQAKAVLLALREAGVDV